MKTYNVHEAKTHLSRLIEHAAKGESFIIAKAGKPLVRVVPLNSTETLPKKRIGFMAGQMKVPNDFNTMGAIKIQKLFEDEA